MSYNIAQFIQTVEEQARVEAEILQIQKSLYIQKEGAFEEALSAIRVPTSNFLREIIAHDGNKEQVLKSLLLELHGLQVMELTLAIEPSQALIGRLLEWIHTHVHKDIILNISYDPWIIAGAKIASNGKYFDGSYHKQVVTSIESAVHG